MDICQSKNNPRGPLIAVIKIQIDQNRTDRIFLHQRDNDHELAMAFIEKHKLNPSLLQHIYERVKFSRKSVEQVFGQRTPHRPSRVEQPNTMSYTNSNFKLQTPINNLNTERQLPEEESFGCNTGRESNRYRQLKSTYQQPHFNNKNREIQEQLFKQPNSHHLFQQINERILPLKKKEVIQDNRQFLFYGSQYRNSLEEELQIDLFGSYKQPLKQNRAKPPSTSKKDRIQQLKESIQDSQRKIKNALEIINKQETQEKSMRPSHSMMKISRPEPSQFQSRQDVRSSSVAKSSTYDKPSHVKIIRKQEIQSLNQTLKRSKSKQEISRINKDVTKRLYNETAIKKNYLKIIKQKAQKDKDNEVDPELTLKPQINKISKVIAEGRKRSDVPVEVYLIQEGKKTVNKRSEVHNKKLMDEMEHCSFKPQLNLISQKLAEDKVKISSRISRKSRYQDQNTFKPSIGRITNELMKDKGNFEQRQKQYLECRNAKLMDMVQERILKEKIDLNTGQQLFRPMINDVGIRENQGSNIGNYLYHMTKQQVLSQPHQAKPIINQQSQQIVQQMHMKRITWLFSELDSDQDGIISSQKINIDAISPEILGIIKPILFEMEQINEELTLKDFKNAIDILHKKLNLSDRYILYNYRQACK